MGNQDNNSEKEEQIFVPQVLHLEIDDNNKIKCSLNISIPNIFIVINILIMHLTKETGVDIDLLLSQIDKDIDTFLEEELYSTIEDEG